MTARLVVSRVREACEALLSPLRLPDRDGATLGGYCATAGMGVTLALREAGIPATLALGKVDEEWHLWTGLDGDRIADVTATQFGGPRVRVRRRPDSYTPGAPCEGYRMTAWDMVLWKCLPVGWWRGNVRPFTSAEREAVERVFCEAHREDPACLVRYGDLMGVGSRAA